MGDTPIVFNPGYTATPGAFRIGSGSNQDMGFVPANDVLHEWVIRVSPTEVVNITVTDGANASNVYTAFYTAASIADGFQVGLIRERSPGSASYAGLFDDFYVFREKRGYCDSSGNPIPEPTTLLFSLNYSSRTVSLQTLILRTMDGRGVGRMVTVSVRRPFPSSRLPAGECHADLA